MEYRGDRVASNAALSGFVFISHARQDREMADTIREALEVRGLPCWGGDPRHRAW